MKIKNKFGIMLCTTLVITFVIIDKGINKIVNNYITNSIKTEMKETYISACRYLNTFSQYRFIELDKNNIEYYIPVISQEISSERSCDLYLYGDNEDLLYKYIRNETPIVYDNKSINSVVLNKVVIDIFFRDNNLSSSIMFNYYNGDKYVTTVALIKDYTDMYEEINRIIYRIKGFIIILFVVIFLLIYRLVKHIVNPLNKLMVSFKKIEEGDYSEESNKYPKDEIGELARGYEAMKGKINSQIETIRTEKERVVELERSKTNFFNNVTHELKTPLTSIYGYAQIIEEQEYIDNDFGKRALTRILSESNRMNKMIVSLLNISKNNLNSDEKRAEINLKNKLLEFINDFLIKAEKKKIKLYTEIEDLNAICNEEEIRTLYINIIDNAIKYSVEESKICIDSRLVDNYYNFTVSNECEKIDKVEIKNVFEPFYCINKSKSSELKSNGLGLYICSEIVNKYNGNIKFDYDDGRAIVEVYLPIKIDNNNILEI